MPFLGGSSSLSLLTGGIFNAFNFVALLITSNNKVGRFKIFLEIFLVWVVFTSPIKNILSPEASKRLHHTKFLTSYYYIEYRVSSIEYLSRVFLF